MVLPCGSKMGAGCGSTMQGAGRGSELWYWLGMGRSVWDAMRERGAGAAFGRGRGAGRPGASLTYKLILFLIKATYINNLVMGVFIYTKESRVQRAVILYLLFYFIYRKFKSSKSYNITFIIYFLCLYIEKTGERKRTRTEPTIKIKKKSVFVGGQTGVSMVG